MSLHVAVTVLFVVDEDALIHVVEPPVTVHEGLVKSVFTVWFAGHATEFPALSYTVPGD